MNYSKLYRISYLEKEDIRLDEDAQEIYEYIVYSCRYPRLIDRVLDDTACLNVKFPVHFYDDFTDCNKYAKYFVSQILPMRISRHQIDLSHYMHENQPNSLFYMASKKIIDSLLDSDDIGRELSVISRKIPKLLYEYIKIQTCLNEYYIYCDMNYCEFQFYTNTNSSVEIVSKKLVIKDEDLYFDWCVEQRENSRD